MRREAIANFLKSKEIQKPNQGAADRDESLRNVYLYVLSMISIIYHITLSHREASHVSTVVELTDHLDRIERHARPNGSVGER